MNNSFVNLVAIQFREFIREPSSLFWALLFPIGLAGVLGLAFAEKGNVTNRVAVIMNSYSQASKKQIDFLQRDATFDTRFVFKDASRDQAFTQLKRGAVSLILEPLPAGKFSFHFDPQNEAARMQYLLLEKKLQQTPEGAVAEIHPITTQGSRYIDFLIPGMIALGVMNSCIWGIGWGLIEWRIRKLLRRMIATPMSRVEFLLAHFVTRLLLCLIESVSLLLFARLIFDVTVQGSNIALFAVYLTGVAAFGGIAILVAARPQKTQIGSGIINMVTLSLMILSGVFFNYTNFPVWAARIIQFLPLTLLADGLRAVCNEGAGLVQVVGNCLLLLAYGVICFWAGLRVFRWH